VISLERSSRPFLGFSDIGGHSLQVGLNDLPDAGFVCVAGNLGRASPALAQRFSQTFEREVPSGGW
jgi:hypothetical protein